MARRFACARPTGSQAVFVAAGWFGQTAPGLTHTVGENGLMPVSPDMTSPTNSRWVFNNDLGGLLVCKLWEY
jgi:hypothetical protein